MNRDETKTLIRAIMSVYPNYKPDNLSETINAWHFVLDDVDYKEMQTALKNYIRSDKSGFAPTPGALMQHIQTATLPQELPATVAWGMVAKAIRNSGYNSVEEFAKLPGVIQTVVGTPDQLKAWAIDPYFKESSVKTSFEITYNSVVQREREVAKLDPRAQNRIAAINANSDFSEAKRSAAARIEEYERENGNKLIEKPREAIPMPEEARKAIQRVLGLVDGENKRECAPKSSQNRAKAPQRYIL